MFVTGQRAYRSVLPRPRMHADFAVAAVQAEGLGIPPEERAVGVSTFVFHDAQSGQRKFLTPDIRGSHKKTVSARMLERFVASLPIADGHASHEEL